MKPEALWFLFSFLQYFYHTFTFFALMVDGKKYSTFSATRKASLVQPILQSTYKGRAEIERVYLPSQLEHTPQNTTTLYVMVDIVKRVGVHPLPYPHQAGLIFPSLWNLHQKVTIATLCVFCGRYCQLPNKFPVGLAKTIGPC
jgi:hypothetical protein